jgi:hypothetical protein
LVQEHLHVVAAHLVGGRHAGLTILDLDDGHGDATRAKFARVGKARNGQHDDQHNGKEPHHLRDSGAQWSPMPILM